MSREFRRRLLRKFRPKDKDAGASEDLQIGDVSDPRGDMAEGPGRGRIPRKLRALVEDTSIATSG